MWAAQRDGLRRRLGSSFPLAAISVLLTACVPTSLNDFPLYLSMRGDEIVFRWCGDSLTDLKRLNISYAVFTPDIEDHIAAESRGHFDIPAGTEFSNLLPPAGAEYQEQSQIHIESRRTMFYVYMNAAQPSTYAPSVVFDVKDPTQIPPGVWIRPNGSVASETCAAR